MSMTYDGAMVLPSNYVVVDQNEMEYVEGGYYLDHSTCTGILLSIGIVASTSSVAIANAIVYGATMLVPMLSGLPVVGWAIAAVGAGYLIANAKQISEAFARERVRGRGIDITLDFYWCVPYPKFTAR